MSRLYLPPSSGATGISPTQASEWDSFAVFDRVVPSLTKTNTAFATKTVTDATATANRDALAKQYIYPLATGTQFTTSQTIKGRVLVAEGANASNLRSQAIVRVIASDGSTVRATLYAGDTTTGTTNPTSEWALTTLTNRQMPRGATVAVAANYTTVAGDYLVIELGYRKHAAASTTGTLRFGDDNATDLPENETTTADNNTWIEFSTFLDGARGATIDSDTFGGTSGTELSAYDANWNRPTSLSEAVTIDTAGRVYQSTAAIANRGYYRSGATPRSAEYDVRADVFIHTVIDSVMGVAARFTELSESDVELYAAFANTFGATNTTWEVWKITTGPTFTSIGSVVLAVSTGATHRLIFVVRDAAKKIVVDGTELLSLTDNTITSVGQAGIFTSGVVANATGVHLDTWDAQDTQTTATFTRTAAQDAAVKMLNLARTAAQTGAISVPNLTRTATQTASLKVTNVRSAGQSAAIQTTLTRTAAQSAALSVANLTRTGAQSAAIAVANLVRIAPQSAAILVVGVRTAGQSAAVSIAFARTAAQTAAISAANLTRTGPQSAAILVVNTRSAAQTAAIRVTNIRSAVQSAAIQTTNVRTATQTVAILAVNIRSTTQTVAIHVTNVRTAGQTAAIQTTNVRTAAQTASVFVAGTLQRTADQSAAIAILAITRTAPQSAAVAIVSTRTAPQSAAVATTEARQVAQSAAITLLGLIRQAAQDAAIQERNLQRIAPQTVAILTVGLRTAPQSAAVQATEARTATQTASVSDSTTELIAPVLVGIGPNFPDVYVSHSTTTGQDIRRELVGASHGSSAGVSAGISRIYRSRGN